MMDRYKRAFLVAVTLISLPCIFLIVVGLVNLSAAHILIWGGMLCLWWGTYWRLRKEKSYSFGISFVLVNLFWWPLFLRTAQRAMFVVENGGMERTDGYGSPVAFLIGLAGEQMFFVPLSIVFVLGVLVLTRSNDRLQNDASNPAA
jgi:hypothetical protein